MLSTAIFLPLVGAIALLLNTRLTARSARLFAVGVSAVPLLIRVVAWARFDGGGGFALVESVPWIPTLGVGYNVGVDGVSLPLAAVTALLFIACIA